MIFLTGKEKSTPPTAFENEIPHFAFHVATNAQWFPLLKCVGYIFFVSSAECGKNGRGGGREKKN
jgi:hypothetical protein